MAAMRPGPADAEPDELCGLIWLIPGHRTPAGRGGVAFRFGEQTLPASPVRRRDSDPFAEDPPGRGEGLAVADGDEVPDPAAAAA
jgi:hypothetical protein